MAADEVTLPGLEPDVDVIARQLLADIDRCDAEADRLRDQAATVADRRAVAIARLVELDGATHRSVADRLGLSPSAVAKAVGRARVIEAGS